VDSDCEKLQEETGRISIKK